MAADPIDGLTEDHQVALQRLDALGQALVSGAQEGEARTKAAEEVKAFISFFREELHALHCRKEEVALFPALEAHIGPMGPIAVMLAEHQELHDLVDETEHALELLAGSTAVGPWSGVAIPARRIIDILSDHIAKEDQVLFPLARRTLSPGELTQVAAGFADVEALRSD